jgi:hypothetical protein
LIAPPGKPDHQVVTVRGAEEARRVLMELPVETVATAEMVVPVMSTHVIHPTHVPSPIWISIPKMTVVRRTALSGTAHAGMIMEIIT